jgi:hypothetical protein
MIDKTFLIDLDINSSTLLKNTIELVINDINTYIFEITIYNGDSVQDLTGVDHCYILFKKADDSISKESITISDAVNGLLSYTFDNPLVLSFDGTTYAEIVFCNSDESIILTSQRFEFQIRTSL